MVKVKCFTCPETMEFQNLTEKDFPGGWQCPACKYEQNRPKVDPLAAPQPKSTVEQWLDACWLRNRSRNGEWNAAWKCYEHYCAWMERREMKGQIVNVTVFGRQMVKLCKRLRKNSGKFYLLEKVIS